MLLDSRRSFILTSKNTVQKPHKDNFTLRLQHQVERLRVPQCLHTRLSLSKSMCVLLPVLDRAVTRPSRRSSLLLKCDPRPHPQQSMHARVLPHDAVNLGVALVLPFEPRSPSVHHISKSPDRRRDLHPLCGVESLVFDAGGDMARHSDLDCSVDCNAMMRVLLLLVLLFLLLTADPVCSSDTCTGEELDALKTEVEVVESLGVLCFLLSLSFFSLRSFSFIHEVLILVIIVVHHGR